MKLAEALVLRADLVRKLNQIERRITENVQVEAGDTPAFDPNELLREYFEVSEEVRRLILRINRTNNDTVLPNGQSIMEAIADRELVAKMSKVYRSAADHAMRRERFGRDEIKRVSTVDVPVLHRKADGFASLHREADTLIQQANWNTELL